MQLAYTDISCGIMQLYEIGNDPSQSELDERIKQAQYNRKGYLIASITATQKVARKFLEKNKFKKVAGFRKNPNTGNKIALYVRRI